MIMTATFFFLFSFVANATPRITKCGRNKIAHKRRPEKRTFTKLPFQSDTFFFSSSSSSFFILFFLFFFILAPHDPLPALKGLIVVCPPTLVGTLAGPEREQYFFITLLISDHQRALAASGETTSDFPREHDFTFQSMIFLIQPPPYPHHPPPKPSV